MRGKNLWIGYLLPGVIAAAVLAGCGNKTADSQLAKTGSEESVQDPAGQTALQPVRNTEDTEFTQRDHRAFGAQQVLPLLQKAHSAH